MHPNTSARITAVQAAYYASYDIDYSTQEIIQYVCDVNRQFYQEFSPNKNIQLSIDLLQGVQDNIADLDLIIFETLHKNIQLKSDKMSMSLLRIGLYELKCFSTLDYKIIINDYVQISKYFLTKQRSNLINAVFDNARNKIHTTNNSNVLNFVENR